MGRLCGRDALLLRLTDLLLRPVSFNNFGLPQEVVRETQAMGFSDPTPVQLRAFPIVLSGKDLIGTAQTGTGKAAAFALPILNLLARHRLRDARPVARCPRATHSEFRDVEILVLDEVDRMLDMGFLPEVRRIVEHISTDRQTLLFSATLPPEIERLAAWVLREPEIVEIGVRGSPAETVTHGNELGEKPRAADHVPGAECFDEAEYVSSRKFSALRERLLRRVQQRAM